MKVRDIYNLLGSLYPFSAAMDFDNCGLIIGDMNADVNAVLVALDCTDAAVLRAIEIGAELIVTHHPVIWAPLKSVTADSLQYKLIHHGISVISAHTNLDIAAGGVSETLAKTAGLENITDFIADDGFTLKIGQLSNALSPDEFAGALSQKLNFSARYNQGGRKIKKVCVCSGSGSDMFPSVIKTGADAYLSSEIKHHIFLESTRLGITCLDLGHEATEILIVPELCRMLSINGIKSIPFTERFVKSYDR